MTTYIFRRLLLMIPTLFGVTIVAFLIMKMAPGDPLLSSSNAQGDARAASRELYLTQKRALGLDKPLVINLNGFRDLGPAMRTAAEILGTPEDELTSELSKFLDAKSDPEAARRLQFVKQLKIPDFAGRLQDPQQHTAAARSVIDFTQVWCEDLGTGGVATAIALLRDNRTSIVVRRGAIHALNHMVSDAFVYDYSRIPRDDETPAVVAMWRLWHDRHSQEIADKLKALSADKRRELDQSLRSLADASSRTVLMDGVEKLSRDDAPFFLEKLLEN